jgi:hypothetical protein
VAAGAIVVDQRPGSEQLVLVGGEIFEMRWTRLRAHVRVIGLVLSDDCVGHAD